MKKYLAIISLILLQTLTVSLFAQRKVQHEFVDLGLSVKWATCNVGADEPWDCGAYYSWGETKTKELYNVTTYIHCNGTIHAQTKYCNIDTYGDEGFADNRTTLVAKDDVAHVSWRGKWRMPTTSEFRELVDNCTWTWTTQNGVNGMELRSNKPGYTDCSIFLPAGGSLIGDEVSNLGISAIYWTSSLNTNFPYLAYRLYLNSNGPAILDDGYRSYGYCVRPVCP